MIGLDRNPKWRGDMRGGIIGRKSLSTTPKEGSKMKNPEFTYLILTAILNGFLWIPVVIGYVSTRGLLKPED